MVQLATEGFPHSYTRTNKLHLDIITMCVRLSHLCSTHSYAQAEVEVELSQPSIEVLIGLL